MTKKPLPVLETIERLCDEQGFDEVLRVLAVYMHTQGWENASTHVGRCRQAIHVNAPV